MQIVLQDIISKVQTMTESQHHDSLLAQLFQELGYVATTAKGNVINLLQHVYGDQLVDEQDIASVIRCMVTTHTDLSTEVEKSMGLLKVQKEATGWDMEIFVEGVIEYAPKTNWNKVMMLLPLKIFFNFRSILCGLNGRISRDS
jgi:hypothetical protein